MKNLKAFLYYITRSSNNPEAMSMAFRGILLGLVAFIVQWAPAACALATALCIDTAQLSPLVEALTIIVKAGLELIAGGMIVFGIARKIWLGRMIHPGVQ